MYEPRTIQQTASMCLPLCNLLFSSGGHGAASMHDRWFGTKYVSNKPLSNIAHRNNQNIQAISISSTFILGYSGCTYVHNYSRLNTISSTSNCYHFGIISLTNPSLTSLLTGGIHAINPFSLPKTTISPPPFTWTPILFQAFLSPCFRNHQSSFKGIPPKEAEGFPEPRRHCLDDRILLRSSGEFIQLCEMNEAQLLHHSAWQPFGSRASRGSRASHGGKGG